ncbi:MAG TPA: ankyrin repeat domain-containing protein, partial [Candidatus Babeliaceae bacterium]|nr:ankyrin repeat domain-containing protein [Candidatus Babeliaceae bacterium]
MEISYRLFLLAFLNVCLSCSVLFTRPAQTEDELRLLEAAYNGDQALVLQLLEAGISPNIEESRYSQGSVLYNAVSQGHRGVVELLLRHNVQVSVADNEGNTPLSAAVINNDEIMVRDLISRGALVDIADDTGDTPLHEAMRHGNIRICQLLIAQGANYYRVNNNGLTPVDIARGRGHENVITQLSRPYIYRALTSGQLLAPLRAQNPPFLALSLPEEIVQ